MIARFQRTPGEARRPTSRAIGASAPIRSGSGRVVGRLAYKQRGVGCPGQHVSRFKSPMWESHSTEGEKTGSSPLLQDGSDRDVGRLASNSELSFAHEERPSSGPSKSPRMDRRLTSGSFGSCPPIKAARTGFASKQRVAECRGPSVKDSIPKWRLQRGRLRSMATPKGGTPKRGTPKQGVFKQSVFRWGVF